MGSVAAPWKSLLLRALKSNGQIKHSKFLQLATIGSNGRPSNRTVVFRGFEEGTDRIHIFTDSRSRKIEELKNCPFAEICWYFTESWEQFRISGRIEVVDASCLDATKFKQRAEAWSSISPKSRMQYLGPSPGLPHLAEQPANEPLLDSYSGPVDAFCLLVFDPDQVDYLNLKSGDSRDKNGTHSDSDSDSAVVNMTPELLVKAGGTEENEFGEEQATSDDKCVVPVHNNDPLNGEQFDTIEGVERMDSGSQGPVAVDECNVRQLDESPADTLCGRTQPHSTGFEISLCGNELHAGMGLHAAAEAFDAHRVSAEEFEKSASSIIKNDNLIIRFGERYMSWEKAAPTVLGMAAFGIDLEVDPKDAIPVEQDDSSRAGDDESTPTSSGRRWRLWPIPFRRVKTLEHSNSNSSNEEIFVDSESTLQNSQAEQSPRVQNGGNEPPKRQLVRTNVPTTEQIASLNLKEGQNMIAFTFSTRVLGTQKVDAHIYLWKWNARIVISDVDGTITKSDVLGQFMPLVGKDWTQSGVARLFTAIKENGYQLLFLSARAIVQAYLTRSFLLNLKQDGKALPNGPIVISPDGLFPSLFREVIRRAPHEFKIACLEDIKKLFPPDYNPFYAGFGNRDTDELSYRKVGIPKGKIFIINPKGEVAISHRIDVKSYTSLHTLVNDMFPPTSLVEQEDYNAWNFWKVPLPDIEL